jgi:uncharacterized repeat protein (TIGR01451 family)
LARLAAAVSANLLSANSADDPTLIGDVMMSLLTGCLLLVSTLPFDNEPEAPPPVLPIARKAPSTPARQPVSEGPARPAAAPTAREDDVPPPIRLSRDPAPIPEPKMPAIDDLPSLPEKAARPPAGNDLPASSPMDTTGRASAGDLPRDDVDGPVVKVRSRAAEPARGPADGEEWGGEHRVGKTPASVTGEAAVGSARADLMVEVKLPAEAEPGRPVRYTITVRNGGAAPVSNVNVMQEWNAAVELKSSEPKAERIGEQFTWLLGSLDAGATKTITAELVCDAAADVTALKPKTTASCDVVTTGEVRWSRAELALTLEAPAVGNVGEPVVIQLEVANRGRAAAENVLLFDELPEGLEHPAGRRLDYPIGRLGPGEVRKTRLRVTPGRAGDFVNRIELKADRHPPIVREMHLTVKESELEVIASAPRLRPVGRPYTMAIEIRNKGATPAKGAAVVANLPEGMEFASATEEAKHDPAARTVSWKLGELAPGAVKTVTVTAAAVRPGDAVCKASITAEGFRKETELTTRVQGAASLVVDVTDAEDPLDVGQEAAYEIRVTNVGSIAAGKVQLEVTLPVEMEFAGAEGAVSVKGAGPSADRKLTFESLPSLAPKSDLVVKIRCRCLKPGDARVRATVSATELSRPIVSEAGTTVFGDK